MIGENTEDLGEVWVNLVCRLCLGENISKLVFAREPMELMGSILLSLSYKVETTFDVAGFAGQFAILGNLNCGIVVNHKDSTRRSRKTLDRLLLSHGYCVRCRSTRSCRGHAHRPRRCRLPTASLLPSIFSYDLANTPAAPKLPPTIFFASKTWAFGSEVESFPSLTAPLPIYRRPRSRPSPLQLRKTAFGAKPLATLARATLPCAPSSALSPGCSTSPPTTQHRPPRSMPRARLTALPGSTSNRPPSPVFSVLPSSSTLTWALRRPTCPPVPLVPAAPWPCCVPESIAIASACLIGRWRSDEMYRYLLHVQAQPVMSGVAKHPSTASYKYCTLHILPDLLSTQ